MASKKIKVVADDKIPFLQNFLANQFELRLISGLNVRREYLLDADALLVRSITQVDETLLRGTSVKFIGSATAGIDHLDTAWLEKNAIQWVYAPGCNAKAVAEYVLCCVAALRTQGILCQKNIRAGIIGVGKIGKLVLELFSQLGYQIICNDPVRASLEPEFHSTALDYFHDLDFICLHTPLIMTSPHPTYHLIDQQFLRRIKNSCVLLNTSRGAVIDNQALLNANQVIACLDVWENEPEINLALLNKVTIGTPHIAGYSYEAKYRATVMIIKELEKFFELPTINDLSPASVQALVLQPEWEELALRTYNPLQHTAEMRQRLMHTTQLAQEFENLRRAYPLRREFVL